MTLSYIYIHRYDYENPRLGNQYQCNSKLKLAPNVINMYKTIPSTIQTFAMPSTRENKKWNYCLCFLCAGTDEVPTCQTFVH